MMKNILGMDEITNVILAPVKKIYNEALKSLNLVPIHDGDKNSQSDSDIYPDVEMVKNSGDALRLRSGLSSFAPYNDKDIIENNKKDNKTTDTIVQDYTSSLLQKNNINKFGNEEYKIKGFVPKNREYNNNNSINNVSNINKTDTIENSIDDNKTIKGFLRQSNPSINYRSMESEPLAKNNNEVNFTAILLGIEEKEGHSSYKSSYNPEQKTVQQEREGDTIDKGTVQNSLSNWANRNIVNEKSGKSLLHINPDNYKIKKNNFLSQHKPFINNTSDALSIDPLSQSASDNMHIFQNLNLKGRNSSSGFNVNAINNTIRKTPNATSNKNNSETLKIDREELKEALLELLLDEAHSQGLGV